MKYIEYGLKNGFIEEIIEGINRLQGSNVVQILNGDIHLQEDLRLWILLVPYTKDELYTFQQDQFPYPSRLNTPA